MHPILENSLYMLGYGISAALIMSLCLGLLTLIWHFLTPINDWDEIKKGNIAVAIVFAAVILGFAHVVSVAISPGS
ncbi:MAG: DUF350 domain-containing protein [Pirellulales bacterium]